MSTKRASTMPTLTGDLTSADAFRLAFAALSRIAATPRAEVHASIPGMVAGAQFRDDGILATVLFRRDGERVGLEVWRYRSGDRCGGTKRWSLTGELERRAAAMLDEL